MQLRRKAGGGCAVLCDAVARLWLRVSEKNLRHCRPMVKCPVLIAKPQISVSTRFVYENLKLVRPHRHPDIDRLVEDIKNKDLQAIAGDMGNVLETVTIPNYPVIAQIKEHMMEHGAVGAMMSGSGPTVFGLFDNEAAAVSAYEAMRGTDLAKQVYLTSIYNNAR